uniref:Uncharacterized protein n=1 Tax=Zooxanthella nutricula TaxID=1333877 RepID=A0A7S2K3Q7_9DINO
MVCHASAPAEPGVGAAVFWTGVRRADRASKAAKTSARIAVVGGGKALAPYAEEKLRIAKRWWKRHLHQGVFGMKSLVFESSWLQVAPVPSESVVEVPAAKRPAWLPSKGPGLANFAPTRWTIKISDWLRVVDEFRATDTWGHLASGKSERGELGINMYDVNKHFVIPWTRGTGSSLALLMDPEPREAELMLSHAWGGSVVDTYNMLSKAMGSDNSLPADTPVFFCTFCLYQPEDGAAGGLSLEEAIKLEPFGKIISSRPKYGMAVLHTTLFEMYSRLWTVHEIDAALVANVHVYGLYDEYFFSSEEVQHFRKFWMLFGDEWDEVLTEALRSATLLSTFRVAHKVTGQVPHARSGVSEDTQQALSFVSQLVSRYQVRTELAQCSPKDHALLVEKVKAHGGFERLDRKVTGARLAMARSFLERSPHSSAQWAFGDGRTGQFNRTWNPLKWSRVLTIDEALQEFGHFDEKDQLRPIVMKIPACWWAREQHFPDAAAARQHLSQENHSEGQILRKSSSGRSLVGDLVLQALQMERRVVASIGETAQAARAKHAPEGVAPGAAAEPAAAGS